MSSVAQLPDDPRLLKRLLAEREALLGERDAQLAEQDRRLAEREAVLSQVKEEAASQLEALRERLAAEHKQAIDALLRRLYAPKSERFDPRQLLLFGLVVDQTPLDKGAIEEEAGEPLTTRRAQRRHNHGRGVLPEHLPRIQVEHDLSEPEKACPACGDQRRRIGEEVSEQLEYHPASFTVIRHVRPKYGCGRCDHDGYNPNIQAAKLPPQPIEKGLAGPGLLAYVVTSKLGDHRVQGEAVSIMRVGLSQSGIRTWLQTGPNCDGQEPWWKRWV